MRRNTKKKILPMVVSALVGTCAVADVSLPSIIDSQMVVQSGTHAPIWGWAVAGEKVTVSFDRIDQRLETSDGPAPNWFELAGVDQEFFEATAEIKGNTVVVSSSEVAAPKFIRMAWNNIAEQNLRDKNGWPVFSFNAAVTE